MPDSGVVLQLFDLVGDELWIARAISPSFDIAIGAVDALVDASTLRLDGNGRAVALIPSEIDPAVQAGSRQGIEIRILSGWSKDDCSVSVPDYSRYRFNSSARSERIDERDACPLTVAGHGVIDSEIAEKGFWSDSEGGAAGNDLCAGRGITQRV